MKLKITGYSYITAVFSAKYSIFFCKKGQKSLILYPGIPTLNPGIPGGPKPSGIPGFRDPGNPGSKHYVPPPLLQISNNYLRGKRARTREVVGRKILGGQAVNTDFLI